MADRTTDVLPTQQWALELFCSEDPIRIVIPEPEGKAEEEPEPDCADIGESPTSPAAVESPRGLTGPPPDSGARDRDSAPTDVNAGAKRTLAWLGAGMGALGVVIVLVFVTFGRGTTPTPPALHRPATTPAVLAVPTTAAVPSPPQDGAIPFTAATDSCPGGPTSPLVLTDTSADAAWVCSRGPQESRLDGQILHVEFLCDRSRPDSRCPYMLSALSVTPGWVPKTPAGRDDWLGHRVPTRMQFNFYNGDALATDPFLLDTGSVHGPVPATLTGKILASRVDVLILHTERPPATPAPAPNSGSTQAVPPGLLDSVTATTDPAPIIDPAVAGLAGGSDPVDATFAVSGLQFFGHPPT